MSMMVMFLDQSCNSGCKLLEEARGTWSADILPFDSRQHQ